MSAMIGVKLTILENYFGQQRKASCEHDFLDVDDDQIMFCPKCGKAVIVENGKLAAFEDFESFIEHVEKEIMQFPGDNWLLINAYDDFQDDSVDSDNGVIFIGVGVEETDGYDMIEIPVADDVRRSLQNLLDPLGLYVNQNFGLWAVSLF